MTDTTDTASLKKQIETAADIIRDLTNKLEAERQRADDLQQSLNQQNKLSNMRAIQLSGGSAKSRLDSALDLIRRAEKAEAEIAALKSKHTALRESMAAIHNTIRGSCGHVSLSVLLGASEAAWRASSTVDMKVKEPNCDKCGGKGSYHCPQMLGIVECECGIVKDGE